jgi:hypothetical protein
MLQPLIFLLRKIKLFLYVAPYYCNHHEIKIARLTEINHLKTHLLLLKKQFVRWVVDMHMCVISRCFIL